MSPLVQIPTIIGDCEVRRSCRDRFDLGVHLVQFGYGGITVIHVEADRPLGELNSLGRPRLNNLPEQLLPSPIEVLVREHSAILQSFQFRQLASN
jgi:hypothetical protein